MYQLSYRSTANPILNFEDLEAILAEAIARNSALNISGCLIYHNNSFVQILEGKKKDVLHVYGKIKTDARHQSISLLWDNKVEHRFFEEWHMAFYRPENKNEEKFVNDLLLFSKLTEKPSSALLTFWANVQKILRLGTASQFQNVY